MDFKKLADIIDDRAVYVRQFADSRAEYAIADSLDRIAYAIRCELAKPNTSENQSTQ